LFRRVSITRRSRDAGVWPGERKILVGVLVEVLENGFDGLGLQKWLLHQACFAGTHLSWMWSTKSLIFTRPVRPGSARSRSCEKSDWVKLTPAMRSPVFSWSCEISPVRVSSTAVSTCDSCCLSRSRLKLSCEPLYIKFNSTIHSRTYCPCYPHANEPVWLTLVSFWSRWDLIKQKVSQSHRDRNAASSSEFDVLLRAAFKRSFSKRLWVVDYLNMQPILTQTVTFILGRVVIWELTFMYVFQIRLSQTNYKLIISTRDLCWLPCVGNSGWKLIRAYVPSVVLLVSVPGLIHTVLFTAFEQSVPIAMETYQGKVTESRRRNK